MRGDALRPRSFIVRLTVDTPDAETPWGSFLDGRLTAQVSPTSSNELTHAEMHLQAGSVQTRWANASDLDLVLHFYSDPARTNQLDATLETTAKRIKTDWGSAGSLRASVQWIHSLTNAVPLSGRGEVALDQANSRWGRAGKLTVSGRLFGRDLTLLRNEEDLAWWKTLAPYAFDWNCKGSDLSSSNLAAQSLACSGNWRFPELDVESIVARLYRGELNAAAKLNVTTRRLHFSSSSDFDAKGIAALLPEKARAWLSQFSWSKPPRLKLGGALTLPAWTETHPPWESAVKPTLQLAGEFHFENTAFRGVPFTKADSDFTYSNQVWTLPDLVLAPPKGTVNLAYEFNEQTRGYRIQLHSDASPNLLRPLLSSDQQEGFDLVELKQNPVIEGEIRGRWSDPASISAKGQVAVTNFAIRGETADSFQSQLEYTNGFLTIIEPHLTRGTQQLTAAEMVLDFAAMKAYVTNGFGTMDPAALTRAIGPHVARVIEPYQFLEPPTARVEGVIPLRNERDADLHFDVDGRSFQWWRFHMPHITGKLDWTGKHLRFRNAQASFYGGNAFANGEFDFDAKRGADVQFTAGLTGVDLHGLMNDLLAGSNHLEGTLAGQLKITHGNTEDLQSWQGAGDVTLRDGLIWDIPVFGILSPALNTIVPGLGSSRARDGSATFTITNGVVRSEDLEIRASAMRLRYRGTVNLLGQVNAHAQTELLRDTWFVGRLVSLALWPVSKIFEYELTGTVEKPNSEPVYLVPKLMLVPLHPFRTLKALGPQEEEPTTTTNAP